MRAVDWIRDHKARSGLVVLALANLLYLLWCTTTDDPASSISKFVTPVLILSVVFMKNAESRKGR